MRKCASCGFVNDSDDLNFCVRCGALFDKGRKVPDASTMPSDPLERGFSYLSSDCFPEAIQSFTQAMSDQIPDDDAYSKLLDGITSCMLRVPMNYEDYLRADMSKLALTLEDRDIITDLMGRLSDSRDVCNIQAGLMGLANEYLYLTFDAMAVYTDLRDLMEIVSDAIVNLDQLAEHSLKLPSPEGKVDNWAHMLIGNYIEFMQVLRETIQRAISSHTPEELDAASDKWASAPSCNYINTIRGAFSASVQTAAAGKLMSKMLLKMRDTQLTAFVSIYFGK